MATQGKRKVYVVGVGMTKVRDERAGFAVTDMSPLHSLRSLDEEMTLIIQTWPKKQVSSFIFNIKSLVL